VAQVPGDPAGVRGRELEPVDVTTGPHWGGRGPDLVHGACMPDHTMAGTPRQRAAPCGAAAPATVP
jgi:hypothetical protein